MFEFRAAGLAKISKQVERSVLNERLELNFRKRNVWHRISFDKPSHYILSRCKNFRRRYYTHLTHFCIQAH